MGILDTDRELTSRSINALVCSHCEHFVNEITSRLKSLNFTANISITVSTNNFNTNALNLSLRMENIALIVVDARCNQNNIKQFLDETNDKLASHNTLSIVVHESPIKTIEFETWDAYGVFDHIAYDDLMKDRLERLIYRVLSSYEHSIKTHDYNHALLRIGGFAEDLINQTTFPLFCRTVVHHFNSIFDKECSTLVLRRRASDPYDEDHIDIVLGSQNYDCYTGTELSAMDDFEVSGTIMDVFSLQSDNLEKLCLYHKNTIHETVFYFHQEPQSKPICHEVIKAFFRAITVSLNVIERQERLVNLAYHDQLTNMQNRSGFLLDYPALTLQHSGEGNCRLLVFDIKKFSDVNNTLGQDVGNEILQTLANRLKRQLPRDIHIARVNVDVFAVLGIDSLVSVALVDELLTKPFNVGNTNISLSASIGYVDGVQFMTGEMALKRAEIALTYSKSHQLLEGKAYHGEMEAFQASRLHLVQSLKADYEANNLQLWYQPQISLNTGRVVGFEALLRWASAHQGFISPNKFIPIAESSGLIVPIGCWVLDKACKHLNETNRRGCQPVTISVNVSMVQFRQPNFVEQVRRILKKNDVPPDLIELELTESVMMDNPQVVIAALQELKSLGCSIAIDDFGTGYSSMKYLQDLPVDKLKVDKTFVDAINVHRTPIVDAMITLGRKLGLRTIAEGVEAQNQADYLQELGCDEVQGYLYGKPVPFEKISTFLN